MGKRCTGSLWAISLWIYVYDFMNRRVTQWSNLHRPSTSGSSPRWPILHKVFTYMIYGGWGFSLRSLRAWVRSGMGWWWGGGFKEHRQSRGVCVMHLRLRFFFRWWRHLLFLSDQSGVVGVGWNGMAVGGLGCELVGVRKRGWGGWRGSFYRVFTRHGHKESASRTQSCTQSKFWSFPNHNQTFIFRF
jgi:hypothetical protein